MEEELTKKYYENMDVFSFLMKNCLDSNPKSEEIDFQGTHKKTKAFVVENPSILKNQRKNAIIWLNSVWYHIDGLSVVWLFEMSYRIRKLIAVLITLERLNLESFGGKPEKCDIPQSIVYVYNKLMDLEEKVFPKMREDFIAMVEKYNVFENYYK